MSALFWVGTTWFVLVRQRLRVGGLRRTEQAVASLVTATVVVGLGMLSTYVCLFALAAGLSLILFPASLIDSWAATGDAGPAAHLRVAAFLSMLGLLIGALGAAFEERRYLHHVTYADEEI
jgi:hypothetical protein